MEQYELTLVDYWRIVRKRKWTAIGIFLAIFISTVIFTKLQTPIYKSSIEISIDKKEKEKIYSVTGKGMVDAPLLTEEIEVIKSLLIMKKVAERMDVLPLDPDERETAIYNLALKYQGNVSVSQVSNTNLIKIEALAASPMRASLLAEAVVDSYIEEHLEGRKKRARALVQYAEKQLEHYQKEIEANESMLLKFRQNEKVFEVTPEIKQVLDRTTLSSMSDFEKEFVVVERDLKKTETELEARKGHAILERLPRDDWNENFILMGLKRNLMESDFARFLLLIDFTPAHPQVIAADQKIQESKDKIVDVIQKSVGRKLEKTDLEDISLYTQRIFLQMRREVLFRVVNKFYSDTGSLSPDQRRYLDLKRKIDQTLKAYNTLLASRDEAELVMAQEVPNVTVIMPASKPVYPVKPVEGLNYLIGGLVGLLFGILLCFIQESMDTSIRSYDDVEAFLKLSVLGTIPQLRSMEKAAKGLGGQKPIPQRARLVAIFSPHAHEMESFKTLRATLLQIMQTQNKKVFLFTSSDRGEGKSTVIANLAVAMAQMGKRILVLESNLRRPSLFKIFGLAREPGLSDVLLGKIPWKEAVRTSTDLLTGELALDEVMHVHGIEHLSILTCGTLVTNPSELLNSPKLDELLKEFRQNFDVIFIDTPPALLVTDAGSLSSKVDGTIIVYQSGQTGKETLKRTKSSLVNMNAEILGIVINGTRFGAEMGAAPYYHQYTEDDPEPHRQLWARPVKKIRQIWANLKKNVRSLR